MSGPEGGGKRGLSALASDVNRPPGLVVAQRATLPPAPPRSREPGLSLSPSWRRGSPPPNPVVLILRGTAPCRAWRTPGLFPTPPNSAPSSRQFPQILSGDLRVAPRLPAFRPGRGLWTTESPGCLSALFRRTSRQGDRETGCANSLLSGALTSHPSVFDKVTVLNPLEKALHKLMSA